MQKRWVLKMMLSIVLCMSLLFSATPVSAVDVESENYEGEMIEAVALTADNIPEVISAASIEENNHIARIFSEEKDMNSIVFLNDDDTATLYYFEEAVKFIDEDGHIKDKSNQLYSAFDDPQFALDYSYVNKDNNIRTYFPKTLSQESGILLKTGNQYIEIAPLMTGQSSASKSDSDSGDTVHYSDIFGTGTWVEYSPTFGGFKEEIVLHEYTDNEFSFILDAGGLTPVCQNNHIILTDASGETVFVMDPIYVYDSYVGEVDEATDGYCHNTWNNVVELQFLGDNQYKITITVDESFLADNRTEYPVYVDPSFTVSTSGSGSSKTIQDVPIYNGADVKNVASGSNTYGLLGYVGQSGGKEYGVGRLLMKFPGLLNNQTYKALGANAITNATLSLKEASGLSTRTTIYANQYSGSTWTESSATYSNTSWSGYTSPSTSSTVGSSSQPTVSFDITKIVQGWKSNTTNANKGIILRNSNESNASYRKDIRSTESSNKPELSITYNFYGCKPYVSQASRNINCHGYACFTNNWPQFLTSDDAKYVRNQSTTTAQALARTKTRMTTWLNSNFRGRWKEVSGPNVTLASNQWMIVMRIGKQGTDYDYHYWYRTNNGPWANKHGQTSSVLLPASDMPTTNYSSGWAKGTKSGFYNSSIVYYVLTQ